MKKLILMQTLILELFFITACGRTEDDSPPFDSKETNATNSTVLYTYHIRVNSCDTLEHTFNSQSDYCDALEDEKLNNNCGQKLRNDLYNANCLQYGSFNPRNSKEERENQLTNNGLVSAAMSYDVQITAIDFLHGGVEKCNLKEKVYIFSSHDQNKKYPLCLNSRVELYVISNQGVLTFHAKDLAFDTELVEAEYSQANKLLLNEYDRIRFSANNPYGFSYVIAEDVTGFNREQLAQWNTLNDRYTALKSKEINARKDGKKFSKKLQKELEAVEDKMELLEVEMKMNRAL